MWLSRFPTSFLCFRICLCVHIWVWMWVECLLLSLSAYSFEAWSLPEPGAYMFMVKLGAISPQNFLVPVFLGVGVPDSLHGCWGPNSNPPLAEQVLWTAEPYLLSISLVLSSFPGERSQHQCTVCRAFTNMSSLSWLLLCNCKLQIFSNLKNWQVPLTH